MLNENLLTSLILSINIWNWTRSIQALIFFCSYSKKYICKYKIYSRISLVCHSQYFLLAQIHWVRNSCIFKIHHLPLIYKNGTSLYCLWINIYFCTRCSLLFMCKGRRKKNEFEFSSQKIKNIAMGLKVCKGCAVMKGRPTIL